jgi:hypothetical protein
MDAAHQTNLLRNIIMASVEAWVASEQLCSEVAQ